MLYTRSGGKKIHNYVRLRCCRCRLLVVLYDDWMDCTLSSVLDGSMIALARSFLYMVAFRANELECCTYCSVAALSTTPFSFDTKALSLSFYFMYGVIVGIKSQRT